MAITGDNDNSLLMDGLESIPIVLTPSRMEQPLNETAAATTILDRKLIRSSGIRDLPELFRLIPGMVVIYESGHKANVKYHGLDDSGNARHLQVLIDGRSVYQPAFSRVIWSDLPIAIEDIERIEVVRGPSSVVHGSNAFLGVINIITRHPFDSQGIMVRTNIGSDGVKDGFARISDSYNGVDYRLSFRHQSDDGFDHDSSGDLRYDTQKGNFLNLQAEIPLSDQDLLIIDLGHKRGDKENEPGSSAYPLFVSNPSQTEQWDFNSEHIQWIHHASPDHKIQVQFFHHLSDVLSLNSRTAAAITYDLSYHDHSYKEERFDLELEDTLILDDALRLNSGGSLRRDYWKSKFYTENRKVKKDTLRAFGNLEWRPTERTIVHAGAMWEREKSTAGKADSNLSPRVAINHHIDGHNTIRASYSEAVSTPDLLATNTISSLRLGTYSAPCAVVFTKPCLLAVGTNYLSETLGLPNTTLKPEHITSREVGWITHLPEQHLDLDLKIFRERTRDLYEDTGAESDGANSNVAVIINQNHANISGVEGQIRWSPSPSNTLILSGAHLFHLNSNDWKTADSFPTNSGSIMDIHDFGRGFTGSAALYYTGKMVGTDGDSNLSGPLRRIDARLSKKLDMKGRGSAELSLVLQHRLDDNPENTQDNFYNDKNKGWLQLSFNF